MDTNRRDFLKGTAWMGAAAIAAGCMSAKNAPCCGAGGSMFGFAATPLKKIRVGCVGIGSRGSGAVHRLADIPGVEIAALCDIEQYRVDAQQKWLKDKNKPAAKEFVGAEAYKALCDWDGVDCIYNTTPWELHVPVALCAMRGGKHAFIEVPSAFTLDECWELVETSEKTKLNCMQLENCCYGEAELLALNLCRLGLLGDLVHAEGAYIHDLRDHNYGDLGKDPHAYWNHWRLRWNTKHKGNQYVTHGLIPLMEYMGINRGDRFDYLVSLESDQFNFEAYGKANYPAGDWHHEHKVQMGDMNTTLVKTVKGRSIMIQHDVSSPRPYSRINRITGTKGSLAGGTFLYGDKAITSEWPVRFGWEEKSGGGVHTYFPEEKQKELRKKYVHPYWRDWYPVARKVGGHGGMDFLMDLRWAYCLQNGIPLDTNVYDLAASCCIGELSERSVRNRSNSIDFPDFTKGAWKTQKPLGIENVDPAKMRGLGVETVTTDKAALNV